MNWDDIKFVLALYRYKTMTNAAKALGSNVATVSRRLDRLADNLGQPLFRKQGHQWEPTPYCQSLAHIAEAMDDGLNRVSIPDQLGTTDDVDLRISAEMQVYQSWVLKHIPSLLEEHPNLHVKLDLGNLSLALGEADISISFRPPETGRLIRKRLSSIALRAYRSTQAESPPVGWLRIHYGEHSENIAAVFQGHFQARQRASLDGLNLAAKLMHRANLAAYLPIQFAQEAENFSEMGPEFVPFHLDIWLSYHESRRNDPLIKLGVAFIEQCFKSEADVTSLNSNTKRKVSGGQ